MDAAAGARLEGYIGKIGTHLSLKDKRKRESFAIYAFGILGEGERKSVEPIAARACADPDRTAALHSKLRLCTALDNATRSLMGSAARTARGVDTSQAVACPVYGQWLAQSRVANASVDIDSCAQHGTWFDCGELAKIAQATAVDIGLDVVFGLIASLLD